MNQSTWSHLTIFLSCKEKKKYGKLTDLVISWWKSPMQQNACWVFETVRIISILISWICFTEKVYGSSPYSPINSIFIFYLFLLSWFTWLVHRNASYTTYLSRSIDTGKWNKNTIYFDGSNYYLSNHKISNKKVCSYSFIFVGKLHIIFSSPRSKG